ncbi:MAG: hypothetical protein WBG43_00585 [Marinifilaceae bacterium]
MQRNKTLKICGLILFVILSMNSFAQHNTTSPFSRFGIGDVASLGKGRAAAMGGVGIALSTPYSLNSLNPASCGVLDSMSFIFEAGISGHFSNYKSSSLEHNTRDMNFDYFAMAFPITNWWRMSMGLNPYSSVGFYMKNSTAHTNAAGNLDYNQQYVFEGQGGINKAYVSQSFIPVKNLFLGVNISYMFGQITTSKNVSFLYENGFPVSGMLSTQQDRELTIKDMMFDFGAQYKLPLNEKYALSFGAIFAPSKTIDSNLKNKIGNRRDTSSIDVDLPLKFGGGIGLYINDNITLGFDYTNEQWSKVNSLENSKYKNNETYALGFEIVPNRRSMKSYLGLVSYRMGVHYTDSYMKIRNNSIKDYGVSFGFGFPLRRSSTYINLAFDLGKRGSVSNTLIEENYAKISLSFSMFSKWFYKQKYE